MLYTTQQSDWLDKPVQYLSPGFPKRLALVDLETTGGSSVYHKIIEIGVIQVDDGQITQRWQSFIDPGVSIPEPMMKRLENAADVGEEGVQIALEIIEHVKKVQGINGIHLMPLNWEEIVPRIVDEAGL